MQCGGNMANMKRCPFCGGKPRYLEIGAGENIGGECIECQSCQASTSVMFPLKDSVKELLIEKWNDALHLTKGNRNEPVQSV